MSSAVLPLTERTDQFPFAIVDKQAVSLAAVVHAANVLKERLPATDYLINLCETRVGFCVSFLASVLAGKVSLLPSVRTAAEFARLKSIYADACVIADDAQTDADWQLPPLQLGATPLLVTKEILVPADQVAAIAFTSGSTGIPQANVKTWRALRLASRQHAARLLTQFELTLRHKQNGKQSAIAPVLVATAPPWHMYGFEWALLVGLVAPITLHFDSTFFPSDLASALSQTRGQTSILVTTPFHLQAFLKAKPEQVQTSLTVCATAPLDKELIAATEQKLGSQILEIYGCSEAGSLAWRNPGQFTRWQMLPGLSLFQERDKSSQYNHWVRADYLDAPVLLADALTLFEDGSFELLGRTEDLIKVAGRRGSLAELTRIIKSIDGVEDAVICTAAQAGLPNSERLAALVVAPGFEVARLRAAVGQLVESVFIPRPCYLVDELPRAATGKLSAAQLQAAFKAQSRG